MLVISIRYEEAHFNDFTLQRYVMFIVLILLRNYDIPYEVEMIDDFTYAFAPYVKQQNVKMPNIHGTWPTPMPKGKAWPMSTCDPNVAHVYIIVNGKEGQDVRSCPKGEG